MLRASISIEGSRRLWAKRDSRWSDRGRCGHVPPRSPAPPSGSSSSTLPATGHTLLLLDAARTYHREAVRQAGTVPPEGEALLGRLGDPAFTHVLVVTLPEATPNHEAAALRADLRRAVIEPAAWVINQSLHAAASHASRLAIVPKLPGPPTGAVGLAQVFASAAVPGE